MSDEEKFGHDSVMKVYFDVEELYYIPQYMPIVKELITRGADVYFASQDPVANCSSEINFINMPGKVDKVAYYNKLSPDWLVIGNNFAGLEKLDAGIKTALVGHGIGPKACYYSFSETPASVRFVEGPYRLNRLQEMYPGQNFIDTGYAKLDPVVNGEMSALKPSTYGLDDNKKTLLYAPTFYPSSIECFSKSFPRQFDDYNIIIKPHYFSLVSEKYKGQRKILNEWSGSDNVYLAGLDDISILPFMAVSDVLISDASSTLFEFAALDKPVVWCDFYKLRWSYRGLLKFRFDERMDEDFYKYTDIAAHAKNYKDLKGVVDSQIENPNKYQEVRKKHTLALAGVVDGQVSKRIAEYLLQSN